MITVLFYSGLSIIRWWERSPFGHVAIRINDSVLEAVSAGVQCREFGHDLRDMTAYTIRLNLPNEEAAYTFAEAQIGKPYDWGALIQDIIGKIWPYERWKDSQTGKWDCSRLVQAILEKGGLPVRVTNWPITPEELYKELYQLKGVEICSQTPN